MRAGDQDRQRVADRLRVALDEGRLDLSEYDERVQQAYAAKTYADLDGLLDDLPGPVPLAKSRVEPHRPAAAPASAPEEACERDSRPGYHGMLAVFVVCTLVWALSSLGSGEFLYFWPGWVLIPVVFAVFAHLGNRGKRRH
ncbi:DUF1707 domain-containing protein [Actinoplanes utahensis]|uniref:DUF1707 domain-containing protein n=1 Tax=Actinoplanes utahensis TaxID=1869 RepID=A0A0A6UFM4_ACTUT|nr:hypothetical protein MB27_32400 [Actinoplanes utahensis]